MSIAERISAFKFIRDIPYKIGLSLNEQDYCCSTKAVMLEKLLRGLGLKTRHIICRFDWTETPIPKNILILPRECGETHQFLQVYTPESNSWVNCDPTWDVYLAKAGFQIEDWNGINATGIAVNSLQTYSPDESAELIKGYQDIDLIKKHLESHQEFYKAINCWLGSKRL